MLPAAAPHLARFSMYASKTLREDVAPTIAAGMATAEADGGVDGGVATAAGKTVDDDGLEELVVHGDDDDECEPSDDAHRLGKILAADTDLSHHMSTSAMCDVLRFEMAPRQKTFCLRSRLVSCHTCVLNKLLSREQSRLLSHTWVCSKKKNPCCWRGAIM